MKKVDVHEAKKQMSKQLQGVAAGEEIAIANRGVPVARLVPAALPKTHRELGTEREYLKIADDFDAPLPMDVLAAFLGGEKRRKGRRC
jgi:prevent-host-death family protein